VREFRLHGSEGGGAETALPTPIAGTSAHPALAGELLHLPHEAARVAGTSAYPVLASELLHLPHEAAGVGLST
jgi:hypothetical protein